MNQDRIKRLAEIGIEPEGEMSEARVLELNRKRFGSAPDEIDIDGIWKLVSRTSPSNLLRYRGFRPRAAAIGLRLAQEVSEPFRMVLIDEKGHEVSDMSTSIAVIEDRLSQLEAFAGTFMDAVGAAKAS